jgi:tripartite-type tricarboxylate transporter receptor subunit TctC
MTNKSPIAACGCALLFGAASASAQTAADYPKRPVRFIIAQTPGGNADFVGRIVAEGLGKRLGQQFVVDNRAGASGIIASEITVKAPADGYTLLLVTTGFAVNPGLYKKLSYDSLADFTPITRLAYAPLLLVVNPALPVHSVKDLIAMARAKPGELNYGTSSVAGATQLATELFNYTAKIKMTNIPYKGAPAMLVDLLGGRIHLTFATMPSSVSYARSGKLRGIAVTSLKRSAAVPGVPTVAESGLTGYEMVAWQGLLAPKGISPALLQRIHAETAAVLQQPEIRKQLAVEGGEAVGDTPEQFAKWLRAEIAKWTKIVKEAGIRAD